MPSKGKKTPFNPAIPPFEGPGLFGLPSVCGSSTPTGTTSPTKHQRSHTLSPSLPHWERLGKDPRGYWNVRLHESKLSTQNTGPLYLSLEVTSYLDEMAKDLTRKLDILGELLHTEREALLATEQSLALLQERLTTAEESVGSLTAAAASPPPPPPQVPGSTPGPAQPAPAAPPPTPAPGPSSWAQVMKRARKPSTVPGKPPAAAPAAQPAAKQPPPLKKGITHRERRLIIKRDGSLLTTFVVTVRDSINTALQATLIQRVVCRPNNDITLITMDTVRASSLSSRVSQFSHLIPGTTSVHLDDPTAPLLVHGIPTTHSLDTIAREITTFNSGLALAQRPRWLTSDDRRANKRVSTVVITITGPEAQDFASATRLSASAMRLSAFSTTFKLERHLRFNQYTQCANCQQFGHHTLKCPNPPVCRWCASLHSTREHSCPTSTCRDKGRLCPHTSPKCASCAGPHDTPSTLCTRRPTPKSHEVDEEDDDMQGAPPA